MIKESLLQYKKLTEAIIVNIKNDLDTEELMNKRGEILKSLLENENLDKAEIKNIYINLKLEYLDKLLKEEIYKSMKQTKMDINNLKKRKNSNIAYGKSINIINNFNKKV
ncbi:hypothetical protein [uncultured Clostridium sp.]|uniref:hypothetical protein n=1 Tax=uncultured Clostridium sp. TaxID=59620 RepID=UPI002582F79C|nr:hypothetical protein [uncultured Clostridium sp.]